MRMPCPHCGADFEIDTVFPREAVCPWCRKAIVLRTPGGEVIDVRAEEVAPAGAIESRHEPAYAADDETARPIHPRPREFTFQLRRVYREDGGCGCGAGCLILMLLWFLFLRGCMALIT